MADITDERLREIVDGTYCGFDEGIAIAAELLTARVRIKNLENGLVEQMDKALKQLPSLADQRWMLVMKHKDTP